MKWGVLERPRRPCELDDGYETRAQFTPGPTAYEVALARTNHAEQRQSVGSVAFGALRAEGARSRALRSSTGCSGSSDGRCACLGDAARRHGDRAEGRHAGESEVVGLKARPHPGASPATASFVRQAVGTDQQRFPATLRRASRLSECSAGGVWPARACRTPAFSRGVHQRPATTRVSRTRAVRRDGPLSAGLDGGNRVACCDLLVAPA